MVTTRKANGAFYTPDSVAAALTCWAISSASDRLLDPSCGDGRFIALHENSVGVERDASAAAQAIAAAPGRLVHEGDFFSFAIATHERFDCAAGNPPFIRYQHFVGDTRRVAAEVCGRVGATFSGLASSWAPFLVAAATLLKPGGRMAFVVPAEIGHAPYAAPLIEFLAANFSDVRIIAVREKLFPELSEDCWLLYAAGYGGRTGTIGFATQDRFRWSVRPPPPETMVSLSSWRNDWNRRLRPMILPRVAREAYLDATQSEQGRRLADFAEVGIGYVSGDNDFFHFRPSEARRLAIPPAVLMPSVRSARDLPSGRLTKTAVCSWVAADKPMLLLRLARHKDLPDAVRRYIETPAGEAARAGYKCRNRAPWWSVPDVRVPDYFLNYMSGRSASLVANGAAATCSNAVLLFAFGIRLSPIGSCPAGTTR